MRVLLDNNVHQDLAKLLTGHEVIHARQMGWGRLLNGDLIAAAESEGFDLMITADKNLQYQQTIAGRKLVIVVLNALFIKWAYIEPLVPQVLAALDSKLAPGAFIVISPEKG